MKCLKNKRFGTKEIEVPYNGPYLPSTYFVTEETTYFKITKWYSLNGILFDTQIIYKNKSGKPYMFYEQVDNTPGFYRRINPKGAHSEKTFDTFYECMNYHGIDLC